ncbi:hypothetical protein CEXT_140141 [Caerostris extrusa]|uniref:Uncharacterized protein n=1 Tax=Caerostris extrusa TaxID=172846 RepID=A0AAV4Y796_CAEEX|nr:hypothetical protein CEXT_140141 [Caerostris extrusa]
MQNIFDVHVKRKDCSNRVKIRETRGRYSQGLDPQQQGPGKHFVLVLFPYNDLYVTEAALHRTYTQLLRRNVFRQGTYQIENRLSDGTSVYAKRVSSTEMFIIHRSPERRNHRLKMDIQRKTGQMLKKMALKFEDSRLKKDGYLILQDGLPGL